MNIELLKYVPMLDEVNTRVFSSDEIRDAYFKTLVNIETTYYPPYYSNKISLSIDDFNIYDESRPCNYLRIKYYNMYYYYFIDSIEYVNENVYNIYITMDTFMTFQCHLNLEDIVLQRTFINRWNNNSINRDYIRENVSKGTFKLIDRVKPDLSSSTDETTYTLVLKSTKDYTSGYVNQATRYMGKGLYYSPQSVYYYFLPLTDNIITSNKFKVTDDDDDRGIYYEYEFHLTLNSIISKVETIECYLVPFNLFKDYFRITGTIMHYRSSRAVNHVTTSLGSENMFLFYINEYVAPVSSYTYITEVDFKKNTAKDTLFDKNLVPCLFDNNYMRISFGDRNNQCTDLIEYYTDVTFSFTYQPLITGERMYYPHTDTYYQSTMATDKLLLNLIKDNWNEYNAYNATSIGMALGSYALRAFSFGYGGVEEFNIARDAKIDALNKEIFNIATDRHYQDKRYNLPTLNTKGVNRVSKLYENINDLENSSAKFGSSRNAGGFGSSLIGTATAEYNAWLAPNTVKTNYSVDSSLVSKAFDITYSSYQVEDIEQVAQYYHRYGYLVNKYLNNMTFNELAKKYDTRYYYNYIQLSSVIVKPLDKMISIDLLDDIKHRLLVGIRYWDINNSETPTYEYDNVERSNL